MNQTNEELNARAAEIMGFKGEAPYYDGMKRGNDALAYWETWNPCVNPAQAFELAEKLIELTYPHQTNDRMYCFGRRNSGKYFCTHWAYPKDFEAETMPLAITRACVAAADKSKEGV